MSKKKKTTKRKKKSNLRKKWDKLKPLILQKIGAVTIFIVILVVLFGLLIYQIIQHSHQNTFQQQTEVQYQQQNQFLETIVPIAQKLQRQYGILASVSMAQAALESNFGTSELGAVYNNLYGVKTDENDSDGVNLPTLEFIDGEWIEVVQRFKVYPSWEASMTQHAELIYYGTSWDDEFYASVLEADTYVTQAQGLQSAGYATDPDYANKLIDLIDTWDLNQYDQPVNASE